MNSLEQLDHSSVSEKSKKRLKFLNKLTWFVMNTKNSKQIGTGPAW